MAAKAGHVDIVKYLVENGAEVNAVKVRIDMYDITYNFVFSSYCILFRTVYLNDNKTDVSIFVLCFCWFLHGRFDSDVIKRVNYVVEQGARVDVRNVTIIMYNGTQFHPLHLIALSFYFKVSNNANWIVV